MCKKTVLKKLQKYQISKFKKVTLSDAMKENYRKRELDKIKW